jgi:hypothetical protein
MWLQIKMGGIGWWQYYTQMGVSRKGCEQIPKGCSVVHIPSSSLLILTPMLLYTLQLVRISCCIIPISTVTLSIGALQFLRKVLSISRSKGINSKFRDL